MEDMTVRDICLIEVKSVTNLSRATSWWKRFWFFFVLINFQLSANHFSVLPCYFMKREDILEKRWILKLILNFRGDPNDTASNFLKMSSDFDAVITMTVIECKHWDSRRSLIKIKKIIANDLICYSKDVNVLGSSLHIFILVTSLMLLICCSYSCHPEITGDILNTCAKNKCVYLNENKNDNKNVAENEK